MKKCAPIIKIDAHLFVLYQIIPPQSTPKLTNDSFLSFIFMYFCIFCASILILDAQIQKAQGIL